MLVVLAVLPIRPALGGSPGRGAQLRSIEAATQQLRGIKPTHPVRALFPSDREFNAVVDGDLRRDNPNWAIDIAQRESYVLGLLKRGQSLRRITFQGLDSQVIGLYDFHSKTLYVRQHSDQAFKLERYVIAHEYTHALQDQHWHLARLLPDQYALRYRNSDAVSAHHALTEGDAVNTQTLYINRTYTRREVSRLVAYESTLKQPALPRAIQRQFYFPYTTGVSFVQALYRHGGMRAVNAAYARLPSSTYEIMHPNAYLRGWRPTPVRLHGVRSFEGWKQVDDDVFGAFGYTLLIWQFGNRHTANRVTGAYRGDRYLFLERGRQNAMLLKSVWSTPEAARTALQALAASLNARYGNRAHWSRHGSMLTEPDGAVYVNASASRLTVAFAPTPALASRLGSAPTD